METSPPWMAEAQPGDLGPLCSPLHITQPQDLSPPTNLAPHVWAQAAFTADAKRIQLDGPSIQEALWRPLGP